MNLLWIRGLTFRSPMRIGGTALGVALAVALVASLGVFLRASAVSMTEQAVSAVPIDWQVEPVASAEPGAIESAIRNAASVVALHKAFYANIMGFQAQTGGTTQTTGPGKAIAFDSGYADAFPREVRLLTGSLDGPLLLQQTAANLHARPGDTITIERGGLAPVQVTVAGVVDMPDADAFFQGIGLPSSAAPQAPPDNVVILSQGEWHRIFDPQTAARPDSTQLQFHVRVNRTVLPSDPVRAYAFVTAAAHNLEARVAGKALVGDNLAARLDAVRGDALYARVLFLFLGIPGLLVASALAMAVAASYSTQRRIEQGLLRVRGATNAQILIMNAVEAFTIALLGVVLGLGATALFSILGVFGPGFRFAGTATMSFAALTGILLSLACVLMPSWLAILNTAGVVARRSIVRRGRPAWLRFYPDLVLLAASGFFFWQNASNGYQIVLAPEGVAATSVDYKAFIAPALFWTGAILLIIRLSMLAVAGRQRLVGLLVEPIAGELAPAVRATLAHQSRRIGLGVMMLSLAVAFAVSTAIFNTTYNAQSRVDAELTNGSDVTVFGTSTHPAGALIDGLRALPGTAAASAMQHRFAYVGADLQDIYGIDPHKLGNATSLSDAYFSGATASTLLDRLAGTPDGVLVSEETVRDFQLNVGDTINLRLIDGRDHQYHAIPFKFVGVVREFPTAPKDSFLVANAAYIAAKTHLSTAEYVLMKAKGKPTVLAGQVSDLLAGRPGLKVKDISTVSHIIGSNLTAVDLRGLTRIELAFAIAMAVAASALLLVLSFFERKRSFAILQALGAMPWQMAAFIWSEGLYLLLAGSVFGTAAGVAIAWMLVKLLTGVFDPPPEALSYPAAYLGLLMVAVFACTIAALWLTVKATSRGSTTVLRDTVLA